MGSPNGVPEWVPEWRPRMAVPEWRSPNGEIRHETSGFQGNIISTYAYDAGDNLLRETQTGKGTTIYQYDSLGNQIRRGLDVDSSGELELASNDRITDTETIFTNDNGWWRTITTKVYPTSDSNEPATLKTEQTRLSGFATDCVFEKLTSDQFGNTTAETRGISRSNKTITLSTLYPNSTVAEQNLVINGLRHSLRTADNLTVSYDYDALGRLIGETDPRTGRSFLAYHTASGKVGQIASITDAAGNKTEYDYNSGGQLAWRKNSLNKYTRYAYNLRGQVTNFWGEAEYPVQFEYDNFGQQTAMKTYRTGDSWQQPLWPGLNITADTTSWTYDAASGLVTAKTDAAGKSVSYQYDVNGNLTKRIWARGIETSLNYHPATAQLLSINYNDTVTAPVSFTYNRLGLIAGVSDAAGQRSFSYNSHFRQTSEAINGIYQKTLTFAYSNTGFRGRYQGMTLDNTVNHQYNYDEYGRLRQINNFTYNRLANSRLIENLTRPNGVNSSWSYETNRNLVTQVQNSTVSTFGYTNDALAACRVGISPKIAKIPRLI